MIDLIGIPFKNGGRDRSGMDCWGLAMAAYRHFNITLPDYGIDAGHDDAINAQYLIQMHNPDWVEIANPAVPCVVALRTSPECPDLVTHVGVYIGNGRFLNINERMNSYVERIAHPWFAPRIEGYFCYVG